MSKSKSFLSILIPSATVFFSSGCIMVLELVAGRLIARYLGSSLYTWTSVIGVVLAGITIGNYLGGRIADRFPARKALAVLFGISSVTCVVVVIVNNLVGDWTLLWWLSWPVRVFTHVALVFLIPSTLLGTISPVVAKMALDQGLPTGRTVGDIYAWGAAGSIAGTFIAGFYLIAVMGTIAIVWTIGAALLLMAILYWARFWVLYLWAAVFVVFLTMGIMPANWAKSAGSSIGLREKPDPNILYEDESQYCYIAVKRISETVDKRAFMQDRLMHSTIVMGDIDDLQYFYTHIYAGLTHGLSKGRDTLSVMVIGGGGYVYPRYIEKHWPGSRIDVVEIDSAVTEAAMQAFGLERDTTINTINMDGRNYVDKLLEQEQAGGEKIRYDFIYEDAINDYSVPYQLVTKEFNDKIAKILADDGAYMVNLIDFFDNGLFLGAVINTLKETFPYVYVITEYTTHPLVRDTYVVVAAKQQFDPVKAFSEYPKNIELWHLDDADLDALKEKSQGIVLMDDYVPVENLLTPVVLQNAREALSQKYMKRAEKLAQLGKYDQSIDYYKKMLSLNPAMSIKAYNEIGIIQAQMGRLNEAIETFRKAIKYDEQTRAKQELATIHHSLAVVLKRLGQTEEARKHFSKAVEEFRKALEEKPRSFKLYTYLGNSLAAMGDFRSASEAFKQALDLNPADMATYYNLTKALEFQGRYDEAIEVLQKGIEFISDKNQTENAAKMLQYLELLEYKKSKQGTK